MADRKSVYDKLDEIAGIVSEIKLQQAVMTEKMTTTHEKIEKMEKLSEVTATRLGKLEDWKTNFEGKITIIGVVVGSVISVIVAIGTDMFKRIFG